MILCLVCLVRNVQSSFQKLIWNLKSSWSNCGRITWSFLQFWWWETNLKYQHPPMLPPSYRLKWTNLSSAQSAKWSALEKTYNKNKVPVTKQYFNSCVTPNHVLAIWFSPDSAVYLVVRLLLSKGTCPVYFRRLPSSPGYLFTFPPPLLLNIPLKNFSPTTATGWLFIIRLTVICMSTCGESVTDNSV